MRPSGSTAKLHVGINRVIAALDERNRRRFAGLWAVQWGWGGITRIATITGLSRPTIARGRREVEAHARPTHRIRLRGAGRSRVEKIFQAS
jgi:hypothetical protein